MSRLIQAVGKMLKVTVAGFAGTLLSIVTGLANKLFPQVEKVETLEAVGLSAVVGLLTGLLEGLRRFLSYQKSKDPNAK